MDTLFKHIVLIVAVVFSVTKVGSSLNLVKSRPFQGQLTNMKFYENKLYIGGTNYIYALDMNLKPVLNASTCEETEENCNNINKVFVIDESTDQMVVCGTGLNGRCDVFNATSLVKGKDINPTDPLLVSTDIDRPAQAMMTDDGSIMIAVTFGDGITTSRSSASVDGLKYNTYKYAISARTMPNLETVAATASKKKALSLQIMKDLTYVIYYKSSFQSDGFSYFVTVQKEYVGADNNVSKLVRLCQNDTNYDAYTDIVIQCSDEKGNVYDIIQSATIVNTKDNDKKMFIGTFTQGIEASASDSVICSIDLQELNNKIVEAKRNFATSCQPKNNSMNYLPDNRIKSDDLCILDDRFVENNYICKLEYGTFQYVIGNVTVDMISGYMLHKDEGVPTSLHVMYQNENTVLTVGTSKGQLIMMNFVDGKLDRYNSTAVPQEKPIRAIYSADDDDIYVLSEKQVLKYSSTDCAEFKACNDTMDGRNPLCGWCVLKGGATRKDSCSSNPNQWLSSLTECVTLKLTREGIPATGVSSEIQIEAKNIPTGGNSDTYKCIFKNGAEVLGETIATKDNDSVSFSCPTPVVRVHTKAVLKLVNTTSTPYVLIAEAPFLFYDCHTYEKCGECVNTSGADCIWIIDVPGCEVRNTEVTAEHSVTEISKCPKLENNNGEKFIPNGERTIVTLKGSNIPNITAMAFKDLKFWCFENGSAQKWVDADLMDDSISCSLNLVSDTVAKKDVRVIVKYGTSFENSKELDDDHENKVTVYNCEKLATDCSHCKALNTTRYNCSWCSQNANGNLPKCRYDTTSCNEKCPGPQIREIVPRDGPVQGNTSVTIRGIELGTKISDINFVKIGNINCNLSHNATDFDIPVDGDFELQVPNRIVCRTLDVKKNEGNPQIVTIRVNDSVSTGRVTFTYKEVTVTEINPKHGPMAGGTKITLTGENLGIGNRVWEVLLNNKECLNCVVQPHFDLRIEVNSSFSDYFKIVCETDVYPKPGDLDKLHLYMDKQTVFYEKFPNKIFEILLNPNITDITGSKSGFLSGGTTLTVIGSGMQNANEAVVKYTYKNEDVEEDCVIVDEKTTLCKVPKASQQLQADFKAQGNGSSRKKRDTCSACIDITIVVKLDGVEKNFVLRYFRDPSIHKLGEEVLLYGTDERQLVLKGEALNLVATKNDFSVTIGVANCSVVELTEDTLRCAPPTGQPAPANPQHKFPEINVNVGNIHVHVGYLEYEKKIEMLAIIAGAAAGGVLFILVIVFVIGVMKYRKVGKKARAYEQSLADMEMEIKRVARQEFLDMHTTMSSVNKNLVEQGFPYHNYQQFACNVMFTVDYLWTEPVVSNGKMTDDERLKANKAMESLESLIHNKFFLVSVITTMEKEKRFFIREKSNLAGNLCAVLMGKMDYLNEILILLMTNLVQDSSAKKHKTLFRRCESITEKLLSNWLSLCLYPHVKKNSGSPLYLLYIATQKTMESGPIDAVTGDAKYTLSEEKLLKKWSASTEEDGDQDLKFEAKALTLNVVVDNGEEIFKCKVLDCDTISQVKSKCLNQIYVNFPASQLSVGANDLALEWHMGFGGALKLRDEDNTSKRDGHWIRFNTLAHYIVKDESNMALVDPHNVDLTQQEDYVNLANVNMDNVCDGSIDSSQPLTPNDEENPHELNHWHLVKKEEESSNEGKSAIAELYLNRLFTTKQSLMEYMRPLFDIVLDHDKCPPPTKFLYDFLDELGEKYKVDTDTVHAWKSHSYAIRVWASLMQMPNLLFDITIPDFMSANLDIISQVFRESFSLTPQKFTKDSPPQKLIFHHEMNHYRERVKEFYKNVKVDPQNSDEFRQYMAEVNRMQQNTSFNKVSALYRFYKQLKPYFEDILENLQTSKEASSLELDRKLEQVIAIMEEED